MKIIKSLPALLLLIVGFGLLPVPLKMINYIIVMMHEDVGVCFLLFLMAILETFVLFLIVFVSVGIISMIWEGEN